MNPASAVAAFERLRGSLNLGAVHAGARQPFKFFVCGDPALLGDLRAVLLAGYEGTIPPEAAAALESQAESLKKWRDKTVITYCDSGVSGAGAARTLAKLGFTKVFNLEGGLNAWIKDNLPLAKTAAGGKASSK